MDKYDSSIHRAEALYSHSERVKLARIRMAFSDSSGNMIRLMFGALFISYVFADSIPMVYLESWLLLLLVFTIVIIWYEKRNPVIRLLPDEAAHMANVRMALGAGISLVWGLLAWAPFSSDPVLLRVFLFVALSALGAIGGIGYSMIMPYVYILNLTSLGPIIIWFFIAGDNFSLLMAFSGLIWLTLILRTSHRIGGVQVEGVELAERLKEEIEKREQANRLTIHHANHDNLTGLANRRLLNEVYKRFTANATRHNQKFGLLMIDLDNFKPVNDIAGHHAGDHVLSVVAMRLTGSCREVDCVARTGGDEFAVLVESVADKEDLVRVAEKIVVSVGEPVVFEGRSFEIGASVGISIWPDHGNDIDHLFKAADQAMYHVKREGKKGYRFSPETR